MKLPSLKSRDIIKILHAAGFEEHRQKGGHKIFKKGTIKIVVPIHSKDLKKGTAHKIIEQAGLTIEEAVKLLK